jgi:hypothetical protein
MIFELLGAGEGVVDGVDGFACGLLGEVAVEVRGGRQGGVPQGLGDHGEGDARGDGDGGGQVPQVVNQRSAAPTRGEMATQLRLDRVLGVVRARRLLLMAESVQRT